MGLCFSCNHRSNNIIDSVITNNMNLATINSDINEFSLKGQEHIAKVVYIYDGDTVHIVINLNNVPTKFNCRLIGIDSPEMLPKNVNDQALKAKEIEKAIKARNYLITKVTDQQIVNKKISKKDIKDLCAKSRKLINVKCFDFDKYGRLLIEIYDRTNGTNTTKSINQNMIDLGYAVAYDGGTKKEFNESYFV